VLRRVLIALLLLGLVVVVVYLDRKGYRDADEDGVDLLDALYYATVSLSTTSRRRQERERRGLARRSSSMWRPGRARSAIR